MTDISPSKVRDKLDRLIWVAHAIQKGLEGKPFHWDETEGEWNVVYAEQLGYHLLSETQITKRGYRLKQRVKPVGTRYFGAPIQRHTALYVLECQAVKKDAA